AAARYSLISSAVFRWSVGSQGTVSSAISVFLCQLFGALDVTVLHALVAAAEQYDNFRAAAQEVDAVSGSVVDPQLRNARPNRTYVARVANGKATEPHMDSSDGDAIAKAVKPRRERRCLPNLDHPCNMIHGRSLSRPAREPSPKRPPPYREPRAPGGFVGGS